MRTHLGLTLVTVLSTIVMTAAVPGYAWADEEDVRARELYRNGEQLYEEGLYEDAIVAWERAYDLSGRPLLLYNIANALERIGKWEEALRRINQYRAFATEAERETLDRRMRAIERRIEEKKSQVEADEKTADPAPNPSSTLILKPQETAYAPSAGPVVLSITGGIGLAVGGVLAVMTQQARSEASALCRQTGEISLCPDTASDALNRDAQFSLGADLSMSLGAAALGTGIILGVLDRQGLLRPKKKQVLLVPGAGPGLATLRLEGTF
jgi:tetratricopeptide (TPR) repeat protein